MSLFDRFLLFLYSLFFTVAILLFAAVLAGWNYPLQYIDPMLNQIGQAEIFGLLAVLALIGLRLFWASVRSSENKEKAGGRYLVLKDGAKGQVQVSVKAIEELVEKTALQMNGIREVKPSIVSTSQDISLKLKGEVTPDQNIPEVSEQLQKLITEKILEVTGVTVTKVEVSIESIGTSKPRVV